MASRNDLTETPWTLEVVKKAASEWKTKDVEFIAQLGDMIDARAKNQKGSD